MFDNMTMGNAVTAIMGLMVLISVMLISFFGNGFLLLPLFIGVMSAQSAFTGFCPMSNLLKKYNLVK